MHKQKLIFNLSRFIYNIRRLNVSYKIQLCLLVLVHAHTAYKIIKNHEVITANVRDKDLAYINI